VSCSSPLPDCAGDALAVGGFDVLALCDGATGAVLQMLPLDGVVAQAVATAASTTVAAAAKVSSGTPSTEAQPATAPGVLRGGLPAGAAQPQPQQLLLASTALSPSEAQLLPLEGVGSVRMLQWAEHGHTLLAGAASGAALRLSLSRRSVAHRGLRLTLLAEPHPPPVPPHG
jgi:hypothetical protein